MGVEVIGEDEAPQEGEDRIEQALPELDQMVEQRHFLVVDIVGLAHGTSLKRV